MYSLNRLTREEMPYAGNYCEENTYKLIEILYNEHKLPDDAVFAVFISNERKETAMWMQRARKHDDDEVVVFWDYHVITLVNTMTMSNAGNSGQWWVLDHDTLLPFLSPASQYLIKSFRPKTRVLNEYRPIFRVVPGRVYLEHFSSDRSHMKTVRVPPPEWPPICGRHASTPMQLPLYWNMKYDGDDVVTGALGRTMDTWGFMDFVGVPGGSVEDAAR